MSTSQQQVIWLETLTNKKNVKSKIGIWGRGDWEKQGEGHYPKSQSGAANFLGRVASLGGKNNITYITALLF